MHFATRTCPATTREILVVPETAMEDKAGGRLSSVMTVARMRNRGWRNVAEREGHHIQQSAGDGAPSSNGGSDAAVGNPREERRRYVEECWRGTPNPCRSSFEASNLCSPSANERAMVAFKRLSQYLRVA